MKKKIPEMPVDFLKAMQILKDDNWLIVLKGMPKNFGYWIPGAQSEYDAPHKDKFGVWKGKWVCEAEDMERLQGTSLKYRGRPSAVGNSPYEVLKKVWNQIHERALEKE